MKIYTIYKATNVLNGKSYIGFTSNYKRRLYRHQFNINHRTQHFYNALRRYGWNNFSWNIIYQSFDRDYCKNVMEPHFIVEYDTFNNGYNETCGGEGSFGYKHTQEMTLHLSKIQSTKIGKLNPFFGKKHSTEAIEENRKKNIEVLTKLKGKKVSQYDKNGKLIATHDGIRSAARAVNLKCYNEISKCCRGIKQEYCGYIWKYA